MRQFIWGMLTIEILRRRRCSSGVTLAARAMIACSCILLWPLPRWRSIGLAYPRWIRRSKCGTTCSCPLSAGLRPHHRWHRRQEPPGHRALDSPGNDALGSSAGSMIWAARPEAHTPRPVAPCAGDRRVPKQRPEIERAGEHIEHQFHVEVRPHLAANLRPFERLTHGFATRSQDLLSNDRSKGRDPVPCPRRGRPVRCPRVRRRHATGSHGRLEITSNPPVSAAGFSPISLTTA